MSYAADMGAGRHKTREEAAQREREMVDQIAEQLQLRPISETETTALSLGVAWGTERAYPLADILAELADQRDDEPSERLMAAARRYNERALARDKQRMIESRTLDDVKTGVVLGDEWPELQRHLTLTITGGGATLKEGEHERHIRPGDTLTVGPMQIDLEKVDRDFHDPHADADPAEHTIPYGWIRTVADAHYGGRVPQVLQDMQLTPAVLDEFGPGMRCLRHAQHLVEAIDHFVSALGKPCPGIFTERLQVVNSYLQQIDNEGGGDA